MTGSFRLWVRDVGALALAYFATGKLGLLLAIPPGYATAIWPPSGIALAALLVSGRNRWPGVLLGSFAVNAVVGLDPSSPALARSLAIALTIAGGASLQAVVGARLIERNLGFPHPLEDAGDVLRFFVLGGPCACVTNALISTTTLWFFGSFGFHAWLANVLTWWAGDVLGVVVIVPIALCFFGKSEAWRRRRLSVALPMAIVFAIAVVLYVRASELEQQRLGREFNEQAVALARGLERNFASQLLILQSIGDFFSASKQVERKEFSRFVRPALERAEGVLALEWIPRVTRPERPLLEATARADGIADFTIREAHGRDDRKPADDRDVYYPVFYVEPLKVVRALGFDVGSEAMRRAALELARDRGEAIASAGLELFGQDRARGVLVFVPVYEDGIVPPTLEARRRSLVGFALGVFRVDEWVSAGFRQTPHQGIAVRIEDETQSRVHELYTEGDSRFIEDAHSVSWSTVHPIAGRRWRLTFAALPSYASTRGAWQAPALLGVILLFCGLLGAFLLVITGRAAELERRSEESSKMLASLVQSSEDAIIAYDTKGRIISWNSGAVRCFGWQEAEALGRDAALFVPKEDLAQHGAKLRQAIEGQVPSPYEAVRITRDGRRLDTSVRLSAIPNASGGIRGVSAICRDISEQKEIDRRLRASLREKEVLLKEVHHRVKNNLQVISSLLHLQSNHVGPDLRSVFDESQSRIQSIALVHEKLYQSKDLNHVDFADYIQTLVRTLFRAQDRTEGRIAPQIDVNNVQLPVDMAIPCGLLIGELVTNALKHAFPGERTGTIHVTLRSGIGDRVQLIVADDGVGLPPNFDPRQTTSLGLDLVYTFAEQLHAEVELQRGAGTAFYFNFSIAA